MPTNEWNAATVCGSSAGPTPPDRVLDELPCEYPLNHRWKVKRGKKETLYAFLHNQTEQFLRPYVAAAGEALAPVTGPVRAATAAVVDKLQPTRAPARSPRQVPAPIYDKPRVFDDM